MLHTCRLVFSILFFFVSLCHAAPALLPRRSPQPPNGTIELHHDPDTSSWYLLVSLDRDNYTNTRGSKTIFGQHNPLSVVTLDFTVEQTYFYQDSPTQNETGYTIYSTPHAFEHHIDDPLTSVYVWNAIEYYYMGYIHIFLDINGSGDVDGQGVENQGLEIYGFSADLNSPLNVTGLGQFGGGPYQIVNSTGGIS